MKAKLASIASATGTTGVFFLRGSDIYKVEGIERLDGPVLAQAAEQAAAGAVAAVLRSAARQPRPRRAARRALGGLAQHFGIQHAMILMLDEKRERFYTLASRGYDAAGVGSEIPAGAGTVGVAARAAHADPAHARGRGLRLRARDPRPHRGDTTLRDQLESKIPFPGLRAPMSQLSVPIEAGERVFGVLHVESAEQLRFTHEDEDTLVVLAGSSALSWQALRPTTTRSARRRRTFAAARGAAARRAPLRRDDSVFLGDDYLIKGVAGAILWRLLSAYVNEQREHFSNRELRVDPAIGLPEHSDNLEARIFLLERRLSERDAGIPSNAPAAAAFAFAFPAR